MKKKVALILVLSLILMVFTTSCGPKEPTPTPAEPEAPVAIEFPIKPITIYNTHAPGGAVDLSTGPLVPFLGKYSPQPIVYDFMEGAGGRKARDFVYNSEPDGYTLVTSLMPSMQVGEVLYTPEYKTEEMTHIYQIAGEDFFAILVKSDSPYNTVQELLEASKTTNLTGSGAGTGTNSHMASVVAKSEANLVHDFVPFESGGAAVVALLGGHVDMSFTQATMSEAYEGVKILAVMAPKRLATYPDVPTFAELGFPGVVVEQATMVVGPPGIPDEVVAILAEMFEKAMSDPEFVALPKNYIPVHVGPDEAREASMTMLELIREIKPIMEAEMKQ